MEEIVLSNKSVPGNIDAQGPTKESHSRFAEGYAEESPVSTPKETEHYPALAILPVKRPNNKLPRWMLDYFQWHQQKRSELTRENWNSGQYKFLIMRCLDKDPICGGTSDRLSSIPMQILTAFRFQRILLIYWERPFALEEFLLPPQDGLDWRVPFFMKDQLPRYYQRDVALTYTARHSKMLSSKTFIDKMIVWTRDQTHNHGRSDYNQYNQQHNITSEFDAVFHDTWRMAFTPAPPVAQHIHHWMQHLGLIPGKYASTHVRALYGVHNRSLEQIREWTENAIRCSTQLQPTGPFFFASDSTDAQKAALAYGKSQGLHVISRFHETVPLHLEANATGKVPADYYDIFVDLYLLGNARSVAYNVGGYGRLGLMMGFDFTAGIQHQRGGVPWTKGITGVTVKKCELQRPDPESWKTLEKSNANNVLRAQNFFAPPVTVT